MDQEKSRRDAPVIPASDRARDAPHRVAAGAPDRRPGPRLRPHARRRVESRKAAGDRHATGAGLAGATDEATRQAVRKGLVAMLVAAAVLLVFNSAGLRTWAHGLPGNAVTDLLVAGADRWHQAMQRGGFATAMATVQEAVAELRGQPWPDPDLLFAGRSDVGEQD